MRSAFTLHSFKICSNFNRQKSNMNLRCELIVNSDVEHLQQIYTGYNLLHQKGFLTLRQTIPNEFLQNKGAENRWVDYKFFNTKVVLNEKIRLCYDLHDWNWIDEEILRESDFYFKRSYDPRYVSSLAEKDKVFRLGLNYSVSSWSRDFFRLRRAKFFSGKDKLKSIIKSLKIAESFGKAGETEQLGNLEAFPDFSLEPKIIFMARAWNTDKIENKTQKAEVEAINETRAECVRTLRQNFGGKFFGGLARDDYSAKYFKDALLADDNLSNKRRYLEILKNFPICVATTGLNGSNGWKLGEYVALSKAVITEPLFFEVPGDFAAGKNFLEFRNAEELANAAARLFENNDLRASLMMNNYRYYHAFLRPDSLILNTLETVFRHLEKF